MAVTHKYNIHSFRQGIDSPAILLRLYCSLVIIELAIKDKLNFSRSIGHDIKRGINEILCSRTSPLPINHQDFLVQQALADLRTQADKIENDLNNLWCTRPNGSISPVDPKKYPDIRYLKHHSDEHSNSSEKTSDEDLQQALITAEAIIRHLRTLSILA